MRRNALDLLEEAVRLCQTASDNLHEPVVGPAEIADASEPVTRLAVTLEQLLDSYEASLQQMQVAADNLAALQRRSMA